MLKTVLLQITVIALMCYRVRSDVFTAVTDVEPLLQTHRSVINSLEDYLNEENRKLNILTKYINLYKREHEKMEADISSYIGHPIKIFTLIKRLTADLNFIELLAQTNTEIKKEDEVSYPTMEDLEETANALLRLTNTYKLEVSHLAQGIINSTFSNGLRTYVEETLPLSASDCFEIGRVLYESKELKRGLEWFLEALQKHEKEGDDFHAITETTIVDKIRASYHELDDIRNALKWTKRFLSLKPESLGNYDSIIQTYEKRIIEEELSKLTTEVQWEQTTEPLTPAPVENVDDEIKTLRALCRGDVPVPENKTKSLYCFYLSGPHPFLLLAPIKTEQLHRNPGVLLFHEVLNDGEIETLKEIGRPQMKTSMVEAINGTNVKSKNRISKIAWLKASSSPVVARITRRVSHFTGLSMETAEKLQLANYGIGGHYGAHEDFLDNVDDSVGGRTATVLFYLSNVEQGGATVFIHLKLTMFPEKGAALFWMNMQPSGAPDYGSRHAACPVLMGSKWAANKWIHDVGQEFIRPCSSNYQDIVLTTL